MKPGHLKNILVTVGMRKVWRLFGPIREPVRRTVLIFAERMGLVRLQKRLLRGRDLGLFSVDPRQITCCINWPPSGFIIAGDWDVAQTGTIDQCRPSTPPTIRAIAHGEHYTVTPQYRIMTQRVDDFLAGKRNHGSYWCRSHADIREYFRCLIQCYDNLSRHGYKSQAELAGCGMANHTALKDEVRVLVGRGGG